MNAGCGRLFWCCHRRARESVSGAAITHRLPEAVWGAGSEIARRIPPEGEYRARFRGMGLGGSSMEATLNLASSCFAYFVTGCVTMVARSAE